MLIPVKQKLKLPILAVQVHVPFPPLPHPRLLTRCCTSPPCRSAACRSARTRCCLPRASSSAVRVTAREEARRREAADSCDTAPRAWGHKYTRLQFTRN